MIVCHCHRVSDCVIREQVRAGSQDPDAIGKACQAGTGCGGCRPLISDIVQAEMRAERHHAFDGVRP